MGAPRYLSEDELPKETGRLFAVGHPLPRDVEFYPDAEPNEALKTAFGSLGLMFLTGMGGCWAQAGLHSAWGGISAADRALRLTLCAVSLLGAIVSYRRATRFFSRAHELEAGHWRFGLIVLADRLAFRARDGSTLIVLRTALRAIDREKDGMATYRLRLSVARDGGPEVDSVHLPRLAGSVLDGTARRLNDWMRRRPQSEAVPPSSPTERRKPTGGATKTALAMDGTVAANARDDQSWRRVFPYEAIALDAGIVVLWQLFGPSLTSLVESHPGTAIVSVGALQCVVAGRSLGILMKGDGSSEQRGCLGLIVGILCAIAVASFPFELGVLTAGSLPFPKACWALPIPVLFGSVFMAGYTLEHAAEHGKRTPLARWVDAGLAVVYLAISEALILACTGIHRAALAAVVAMIYLPMRTLIAFMPPATRYELLSASIAFAWLLYDIVS